MIKCKFISNTKIYKLKLPWWKQLLGYCPCCGRYFRWPVTTERRCTEYSEPKNNYLTACKECHREDDDYYNDLWKEYYAGRL
jgi:hypothetical protein